MTVELLMWAFLLEERARLILIDGAVPAIKYPGHDSELQKVSETVSHLCVFVGDQGLVTL